MVTSTSKKLYGYLKGYETCCYTGAPKSVVANSTKELLDDEMAVLFPSTDQVEENNDLVNKIAYQIDRYLTEFYCRMRKIKTSTIVKEVADKAKEDSNRLSQLMSLLLQGRNTPLACLGVGAVSSNTVNSVCDICDGCPYYLNSKFCIIYQNYLNDDVTDLVAQLFVFKIPETKYLALAMLYLANKLIMLKGVSIDRLADCHMLFNHILVNSKIFELMNPSGETRQKQIDETKKLLTQKPLDRNSEKYQYYLKVFDSVCNDITEGKKPYIKAMRKALDKNKEFIQSLYDYKKDPYYSLKGTGQSGFTGYHQSVISSIKEVDYYADLFDEFDKKVGFTTYYTKKGNLNLIEDKIYCIRTILINNPAKFKGRIIHIFDNPIQDRANYLQRRTKAILSSLANDCMKNQDKGREFLRLETLQWVSETDPMKKIGIYNFDFTNATDTLDQYFQWKVLNFIFGPEIANFWDTVAKLPKFVQNVDGSYEQIDQNCGQPQGGLSSFNDFSLAHHFIFLMDMKELGYEDYRAEDFYAVLGDDSTFNSIEPEYEYFNREDKSTWIEGIPRSDIERLHIDICTNFAGFIINHSKSESVHYDDEEAKLDFAKVTYRNGHFFSPIPFRLAMNYSRSNSCKLAVAIWRGERKEENCVPFMDVILNRWNNSTVTAIIKSGILPFLDPFYDASIQYNTAWLARLRYCSAISYLNIALSCLTMTDNVRDWASIDEFDEAFLMLFKKWQIPDLNDVSANHKIFNVINRNIEVLHELKQVYEFEDQDDQVLALITSPLSKLFDSDEFEDELLSLGRTSKMLKLSSKDSAVDVSTVFPDFNMAWRSKLQEFSNCFLTRGIAKKPREEVVLFRSIITGLNQLDAILGYLYPIQPRQTETVSV